MEQDYRPSVWMHHAGIDLILSILPILSVVAVSMQFAG